MKPLGVTVAPGETFQAQVRTKELADKPGSDAAGDHSYRFYFPLHRGDTETGSMILAMP